VKGAFRRAMAGLEACQNEGIKVGLRFTINRRNSQDVPGIFSLLRDRDIPRVCFYHLVYAGRGSRMIAEDLDHGQTRGVVDLIIDRTRELFDAGHPREVLTVDNHADGVYLYLRLKEENPQRAAEVLTLLRMNGGNSSGHGIGCVSWDGSVYADQFWRHHCFGNVRERPFGEIWTDLSDPLMARLKNKKAYVKGRCARCGYLELCGGNFRVRAEAVTGDLWEADPACYLRDEEIGLTDAGAAAMTASRADSGNSSKEVC
jgi:radical SAM protein with 4Fe4S-binding SPASM domain